MVEAEHLPAAMAAVPFGPDPGHAGRAPTDSSNAFPTPSHWCTITGTGGTHRAGTHMSRTEVFAYINESPEYRWILAVFAGTFFAELTPDEVTARLAEAGVVLPAETVAQRLESLRRWGNLEVSASVGAVSTVADYYRRRNRYLITRVGQEVHELVEGVLAQVDDVRDVSLGRIDVLAAALEALLRFDADAADPGVLADAVRAVFDPHRAFSAEITQFFVGVGALAFARPRAPPVVALTGHAELAL